MPASGKCAYCSIAELYLRKGLTVRNASSDSAYSRLQPPKKKVKARSKRVFDPDKYNTRFIGLKLAYLGHNYNGFEAHVGSPTPLPTIEDVLWNALVKTKLIFKSEDEPFNWDGCEYSKCGRTDKGVSAFGQVIGLKVRSNRPRPKAPQQPEPSPMEENEQESSAPEFDDIHDELPYPHLLNRVLPPDVRVLAWCPNPPAGFSARFSCRQRKYRYFFTQPAWTSSPQATRPDGKPNGWLDIEAMAAAAKKYEGLHDFRNFCKIDAARQITNFERCVERAEIIQMADKRVGLPFMYSSATTSVSSDNAAPCVYSFDVSGSAFLWHQVRHLVAVLFLIGQGFEKPEIIDRLLDIKQTPGRPLYEMADDRPLVLWECAFPADGAGVARDALQWVYPGDQKPSGQRAAAPGSLSEGRYGPNGINEVLWDGWYSKKIDEILAGELLNIAETLPVHQLETQARGSKPLGHPSARLFDGSGRLRSKGKYVPVLNRDTVEAPEVLNARWRENNKDKAKRILSDVKMINDNANA